MAFKTRRQNRYISLRNSFFLPFEARPLSKVPTRLCPYLRDLMVERRDMAKKAKTQGKALKQFEDQIKELYRINRWLKRDRAGKIIGDSWKMLRDYEDRWRARQPEYTSPWQARYRKWKDFYTKLERTRQKQRGLA